MDPLGLVYEGQGTGAASVLGTANPFDITEWSNKRAALAQKQLADRMAAAKAAKEANMKFMDADLTKAWQPYIQKNIAPLVQELRETVRPYYDQGIDVSQDIDAYQKVRSVQDKIEDAVKRSQNYGNFYNLYANEFAKNSEAYDPETAKNIVSFASEQDDAKRDSMIGNVLVPAWDPYAPIKGNEVIPHTEKETVVENGVETITNVVPDLPTITASTDSFLKTEKGKNWVKKGIEKGDWRDKDEAKLFAIKNAAAKVGLVSKKTLDEPRVDKNAVPVRSINENTVQVGKYIFTKIQKDASTYTPSNSVTAKGGKVTSRKEDWISFQNIDVTENKPNIYTDENGQPVFGTPKAVSADGKSVLLEVERTPTLMEKAKGGVDKKFYNEKKVPYKPNEGTFVGEWGGYTADEIVEMLPGEKTVNTGVKSNTNKKATKLSVIKSKVGTPGFEGYTEQELIDYYKSQGYTIE